jgi:hypothetical protein
MKQNYQLKSIEPNVWTKQVHVELTDEQKAIIQTRDREAITELNKELAPLRTGTPTEEEITMLDEIFNEIKPTEEFTFIGLSVTIEEEKSRGILNYRIGEEHLQKRF